MGRSGHRQIVPVTSERTLLTVLLPAQQVRESVQRSFQTAVAELLTALPVPTQIANRELAAVEPIRFARASNRSVIGSMNEFVLRCLRSALSRTTAYRERLLATFSPVGNLIGEWRYVRHVRRSLGGSAPRFQGGSGGGRERA